MVGVDNWGAPVLCAEPPIISGCCACVTLSSKPRDHPCRSVAGDASFWWMRCGERVDVEDLRVPILGKALEDNRRHPVAGDCLLIVVRSAGALTGTRHDPGAAPPVVSGTTLPATGGQITFGVPTDLAEQIPGVPTDGIEGTVSIDVAELCRWIPGVAPHRYVGGTVARMPGFCVMPEGGFTSTRPDPRAAPPVVSGTTKTWMNFAVGFLVWHLPEMWEEPWLACLGSV